MNDLQTALMARGYRPTTAQEVHKHTIAVTTYTEDGRLHTEYRLQNEYDIMRKNVMRTNNARKLQYCL